jgi:hypothetical protein
VDDAALPGYGFTGKWYNRDYKEGNYSEDKYVYKTERSLFKLCEVTKALGTSAENLHDAKSAGVDCKNMNLYKCVSFCIIASNCKSVFFYEGPMDSALQEPRYLCTQLMADLDDKAKNDNNTEELFFNSDTWTTDLKDFPCPATTCNACTHKSNGGISACKMKEFLKTVGDEEDELFPLVKKTGSKIVFMDHIASSKSTALADLQSKFHILANNNFTCYE